MIKQIENNFCYLFVLALIIGFFLPNFGNFLNSYILIFIFTIILLSFLKIDIKELFSHFSNIYFLIYILIMLNIILPIVMYYLIKIIYEDLAITVFVLTAMPSAFFAITLTDLTKGNISFSTLIVVLSVFMTPITFPILIKYILFIDIQVPVWNLFRNLLIILVIPAIFSYVIKSYFPKQIKKTIKYYPTISIFAIMLIIIGSVFEFKDYIIRNWQQVILIFIILFLIAVLLHLIGWLLALQSPNKIKNSTSILTAHVNLSLALYIAQAYFGPLVILSVIIYELVGDIVIIPYKYFLDRNK